MLQMSQIIANLVHTNKIIISMAHIHKIIITIMVHTNELIAKQTKQIQTTLVHSNNTSPQKQTKNNAGPNKQTKHICSIKITKVV